MTCNSTASKCVSLSHSLLWGKDPAVNNFPEEPDRNDWLAVELVVQAVRDLTLPPFVFTSSETFSGRLTGVIPWRINWRWHVTLSHEERSVRAGELAALHKDSLRGILSS